MSGSAPEFGQRSEFYTFAPETLAQLFTRPLGALRLLRLRRHQQIEHALFRVRLSPLGHLVETFFAHHVDPDVEQVADHRFDVAADVPHLGELACFHLHERRVRQLGQAARQFGLAHAGGADHEDVLRHHLFGHLRRQLLPSYPVAQRNRHRAFGIGLPYDVLIQFPHDLSRRKFVESRLFIHGLAGKIDHHVSSAPRK